MRRVSISVAVLVVMTSACSGGPTSTSGEGAIPTTSSRVTTTTGAPATTVATTTTTTTPSTTTTTTEPDSNALASGSGCTPGSDDLPDGEWFGYVVAAAGDTVDFDLACWFTGDAAVTASAEDGEESPPPNDYYIRNENPMLRTIAVADGVEVLAMTNVGDPATEAPMSFSDWVALRVDGADPPMDVWIVVTDGAVASIREQYRP